MHEMKKEFSVSETGAEDSFFVYQGSAEADYIRSFKKLDLF